MHFATVLADSLHHSSIKVYLAAVRSLYIDYGFPDPLLNKNLLSSVTAFAQGYQTGSGSSNTSTPAYYY